LAPQSCIEHFVASQTIVQQRGVNIMYDPHPELMIKES